MSSILNMISQAPEPDDDQDVQAEAAATPAPPARRTSRPAAEPKPRAARPRDIEPANPPVAPAPVAATVPVIDLPELPPVEARVSLSTRMTPTLQKALRALVGGYQEKGYRVTGEIILECLMEELLRDPGLQARVTARAITKR